LRLVRFPFLWLLFIVSLAQLSLKAQTPTLSIATNAITIHPGDSNVSLNVSLGSSSYSGPVTVAVTGLPSGISVTPAVLTAGGSGQLTLSASRSADNEAFYGNSSASNTVAAQVVATGFGTVLATVPLSLTVSLSNPSFAPSPQAINLPIVNINTNGVPIVTKTDLIPGTLAITSADGQTTYFPSSSGSGNTATFHVHGNSTALMPKLPYEMKLSNSIDLLTAMGAKCPYVTSKGKAICDKSKTYILLANYDDKTFLRDWAASALANAIPIGNGYLDSAAGSPTPSGTSTLMPWAPHSLFVELYLNGVYEGNYQIIEKVNVDSNRININELAETDTTDNITGGYFLEIDRREDEDYVFTTPQGVPIGLQDPDYTPEVPEQTAYITNSVDDAENALFSSTFTDPTLGWRAYFDEASLVNFYIVNDLMGNVDGGDFNSSDYLYKSKDNPLLYMGPVWDFDISSGNVNYMSISDPTVPWTQTQSPWYSQLFKDPAFKADVATQWNSLKKNGVFSTWLKSIQDEAQTLEQSQVNNFGRWPMQSIEVWPNIEAAGSYVGEVSYMTNWLNLRIAYLDSVFNNKTQTTTSVTVPSGALRQDEAVTLQATLTGGTAPSGTVSFLANGIVVGIGALDGSHQASLTAFLPAGNYAMTAVYSGDDTNALSASTGATVTISAPLVSTYTNLSYAVSATGEQSTNGLAALVIGNSGTTPPTGTVSLIVDEQTTLSANLSGGTASLVLPALLIGNHTVQAVYSGDSLYLGSSSNSIAVIVAAPVGDFTLGSSDSSLSVSPLQSATTVVSITPQDGFHSPVIFTCSGLPVWATCFFAPAIVTPSGDRAQTVLSISAVSTGAAVHGSAYPLFSSTALALSLCGMLWKGRRRLQIVMVLIAVLSVATLLNGCGTSTTDAQTSTVTVVATSGSLQHTTTISVTLKKN
jgi:hypothetical protein